MVVFLSRRRKKNKISSVRALLFAFFFLLMISGIGMVILHILQSTKNKIEDVPSDSFDNDNMILNTLLVGSDSLSKNERGRSDSMILITIDAHHHKIKVTSLMRDLWVPVPKHGYCKLNAAYSYGGIDLLKSVIKSVLGVKIDRYVIVDFEKFKKVIDKLGGIDLELSKKEVSYVNANVSGEHLEGSGKMHLNGEQALQFARDRNDPSADFKRTERQRDVISAIINRVKSIGVVKMIPIITEIIDMVETDFIGSRLISLADRYKKFADYSIVTNRVPEKAECKNINNQSVLVADLDDCKESLLEIIYEDFYVPKNNIKISGDFKNNRKNVVENSKNGKNYVKNSR